MPIHSEGLEKLTLFQTQISFDFLCDKNSLYSYAIIFSQFWCLSPFSNSLINSSSSLTVSKVFFHFQLFNSHFIHLNITSGVTWEVYITTEYDQETSVEGELAMTPKQEWRRYKYIVWTCQSSNSYHCCYRKHLFQFKVNFWSFYKPFI
jgi:hypothetical protein